MIVASLLMLASSLPVPGPATIDAARYYTSRGPVTLQPSAEPLVVRVSDSEHYEKIVAGRQLDTLDLWDGLTLIRGAASPTELAVALEAGGAIDQVLAVYVGSEDNELLVADRKIRARFSAELSRSDVAGLVRKAGGASLGRTIHAGLNIYEILAPAPEQTVAVAALLHESRQAIWATPDFIYEKTRHFVPSDPIYSEQWHLDLIAASGAWDISMGDAAITIAILDSGVDMTHPDLAAKLLAPRDTLSNDNDPQPGEQDAHGTACAGLAAAITNNDTGVAGVCPNCTIIPIRMLDESGFGRFGADSDAMYWANNNGAAVLSNSWGPAGLVSVPSNLDTAITEVAENGRDGKGALILFAAGNDARENAPYELASHPLVIGVGATTSSDLRADYSNFGDELIISAPAGSVTTDIQGSGGYANGDYMGGFSGTSAAAPVASGLVGLILSIAPELTRGQVQSILAATADKVSLNVEYDENGFSPYYGYGRINALRAAQMASGGDVCEPLDEDCTNGVDDDCDFLIDSADPSCMPENPLVGVACSQDFQCGPNAFCLGSSYGFPAGYCSIGCNSSCPDDGVCVAARGGALCLDGCDSIDDCRSGYDCLDVGDGNKACYPSCTVNGCGAGEFCNEGTGECEHDGAVLAGGACSSDVECESNGRCLAQEWGFTGGFCRVRCSEDTPCADGYSCRVVGGRSSVCLKVCEFNEDCRSGYACNPVTDGTGACWLGCSSDADCGDGDACNEWGLCGSAMPPGIANPPPPPVPDSVCACDLTTACDSGCRCDPECEDIDSGADDDGKGCAAAPGGLWAALGAIALIRRRRVGHFSQK